MSIYDNTLYITTVILFMAGILILLFITVIKFTDSIMFDAKKNKFIESKKLEFKQVGFLYVLVKRALDIALSSIGLILFLPLIIFTAIYIKIVSPGPIFSCKRRLGLNKKEFISYRFRIYHTNKTDSDCKTDRINDVELIRCGRFIRDSGIAEMPLFINILKGDMSFVGRSRAIEFYGPDEELSVLYSIKPGIVNLWSISNDRHRYTVEELFYYDRLYASVRSMIFDSIMILRAVALTLGLVGLFK